MGELDVRQVWSRDITGQMISIDGGMFRHVLLDTGD